MKSSGMKEKLFGLHGVRGVFTKVRSVVSKENVAAAAFGNSDDVSAYDYSEESKAYQLAVELQKARAEEMAHRVRQRMV